MMKPSPHLGLPTAVKIFHGGLKPGLPRRSKHGGDVQAQAETADAPHRIRELVRPLKARIVIELGVSRQAEGAPMLQEGIGGSLRGDRALRPGRDQAPVQRNPVQDFYLDSPFDHQTFDKVEAVQLALTLSDLRKIPAGWRRRPSHTPLTVQDAAPLQDPSNRSPRRQRGELARLQFPLNGSIPVLPQGTALFQFSAQSQNEILSGGGRAARAVRDPGAGRPRPTLQAAGGGAREPLMHST